MQCPYCGKHDTEVIDSRPTKDGISIRRRRQCLACAGRFTTHECREENLMLFLVKKNVGQRATIANLKTVLASIAGALRALTQETEKLIKKAARLEKIEASKKKTAANKSRAGKAATLAPSAMVFEIIRQHKTGVHISKLQERTGFDNGRIRSIVSRACRVGKIKRVGLGVYIAA